MAGESLAPTSSGISVYGMKFRSSGKGPAIGTLNSGPGPSGAATRRRKCPDQFGIAPGRKFRSSGKGPAMGTSKQGTGFITGTGQGAGFITVCPSEAKKMAICVWAPIATILILGSEFLTGRRKLCGSVEKFGSAANARSWR